MKYFRKALLSGFWLIGLAGLVLAEVNSAKVQPLSPQAGKASVYEVRFRLTEAFPKTGSVTLEFPQDFDLSQLILAGSPNVKGGFKVFVKGQKVRLQRSGLGEVVPPKTEMIIRLANVKNPKTPGPFSVSLRAFSNKRILGEVNDVSFSILPRKRGRRAIR